MGSPAQELAGCWVELGLSVEAEFSGRALTNYYYMGPGGLWWSSVLDSALPPWRLRPDRWLEHHDPASHTAWKKRKKKKKKKKKRRTDRTVRQMVKAKLNRENHTKKHTHIHKKRKINKRKRATKPIKKPTNENKH